MSTEQPSEREPLDSDRVTADGIPDARKKQDSAANQSPEHAEFRRRIELGIAQLERGESTAYESGELARRFDVLSQRLAKCVTRASS